VIDFYLMRHNGWHVKTAKVKHQNEDNTLILLFLHACYVLCSVSLASTGYEDKKVL
jgi:hypothetical protein